jgi:hypothetical protein
LELGSAIGFRQSGAEPILQIKKVAFNVIKVLVSHGNSWGIGEK